METDKLMWRFTPSQQLDDDHPLYQWMKSFEGHKTKGEIHPGSSSHFELPLDHTIHAPGFITCPAGIAITDNRLWIAHLPFQDYEYDAEELWHNWSEYEEKPPKTIIALGAYPKKVSDMYRAICARTGIAPQHIIRVAQQKNAGVYTMRIKAEEQLLQISFIEDGLTEGINITVDGAANIRQA